MNCPSCGAVNDADARFCAECGAPLENEAVEAAKTEQTFIEADEDATILSTSGAIASEAETVAVSQVEEAAGTESTEDSEAPVPPEPEPPPPPAEEVPPSHEGAGGSDSGSGDAGGAAGGDGGGGVTSSPMLITIVVIAVLGLCCCCCSVGFGINFGESITFMLYDISESLGF